MLSTVSLILFAELLGQGLQLSLQHSLVEKAKMLSYELVECYGQFDNASSSQYLAVYQVCYFKLEPSIL